MYESFKENRQIVYKGNIISLLPYKFIKGSAVVYNNRLHILGGQTYEDEGLMHYSWDGNSWRYESTLPYSFESGSAVVYDGKIHILGGVGYQRNHYVWDGITAGGSSHWSSVTTLPTYFFGSALVWQNKIQGLGFGETSSADYKHYTFDGNTWTYTSDIKYDNTYVQNIKPYDCFIHDSTPMVVYGNSMIVQWNGTAWTRYYTRGFSNDDTMGVSYNGYIYGVGGMIGQTSIGYRGYSGLIIKIDGTRSEVDYSYGAIPYSFNLGGTIVFNNHLYLIGGYNAPKVLFDLSSSNNFI